MKIMIVDDEELAINSLKKILNAELPGSEIISFLSATDSFDYLRSNPVDIAFLDIEMGALSGLALAKKCKDLCPLVNIIFVTGFSQYSLDALKLHVSGYLLKPVRAEDLHAELDNLRHPLHKENRRVRIQTFGNFEVFVDGKPLKVPRTKCKECLAYLVDRKGAGISYSQLTSVLWENYSASRSSQKNTHKVISDLIKALKDAGVEDILNKTRTDIAIDINSVDCDYFSAISGDMRWMNSFTGEYMTNYSWAEFTLGELIEIKQRNIS